MSSGWTAVFVVYVDQQFFWGLTNVQLSFACSCFQCYQVLRARYVTHQRWSLKWCVKTNALLQISVPKNHSETANIVSRSVWQDFQALYFFKATPSKIESSQGFGLGPEPRSTTVALYGINASTKAHFDNWKTSLCVGKQKHYLWYSIFLEIDFLHYILITKENNAYRYAYC